MNHQATDRPIRFRIPLLLTIAVLAMLLIQISPAPAQSPSDAEPERLEVVLLGTGIPLANPERATAATLIVAGDRTFLVDTGRGSFVRLAQAGYNDITAVLYTHFHSDHIADLGEILMGRTVAGADSPLLVLAPVGARQVTDGFIAAYALDTGYRVAHHGEHFNARGVECEVRESVPGVIYDEGGLRITMFEVNHEPIIPAVGYRFDYNGSSVVVSGDTKKSENLAKYAQGCDILVHEAMNTQPLNAVRQGLQARNPRTAAMLGDAMGHHTSTLEVAEIARDAGVKKLVLTHLFPSIAPTDGNEAVFVRGMSEIYTGPIVVGRDLMRIACPPGPEGQPAASPGSRSID